MPRIDSENCGGPGDSLPYLSRPGVFFGKVLPSSFLPDEDQGYMYVQMQLPEASSLEATSDAAREVEAVLKDTPGVQVHQHRDGIQSPQPDPYQLQRIFLGDAAAMGRAQATSRSSTR